MASFRADDIALRTGGELVGSGAAQVSGIEQVGRAGAGQLTFIRDAKRAAQWSECRATVTLVTRGLTIDPGPDEASGRAVIFVSDADVAMVTVLEMFAPAAVRPPAGVHPTAVIDPSAKLGAGIAIGPHCVIGANVSLGDRTVLHASVTILDHTTIGKACELFPGVVIRDRCTIGNGVILHPNVVIGADGFGYAASKDPKRPGMIKFPHIGGVVLGDDVEIGAGSCVDRGKFADTTIGTGTKIDNQVQIGHNVQIGRYCAISGQAGIAGSAILGDGVILGGKVAVRDNITIGSGSRLAACSAVMNDVPPGQDWGGYPARDVRVALREHAAFSKLPDLVKAMRKKEPRE